jgi:indole-3-glycerol phosphate synthase
MLARIVEAKLADLALRREEVPRREVMALASQQPPPLDFAAALSGANKKPALIAEVKRASPSKGPIRPDLDAVSQARLYAEGGASAVSVLTEERFFRGSLEDVRRVKDVLAPFGIPVLRKDFIVEPYQVCESRAWGADAVLLIVAILNQGQITQLMSLAGEMGMACLVEVHREGELQRAVEAGAGIIGINNRDLTTFSTDIRTTERLRSLVPEDRLVVSESGIGCREDVDLLRKWNVDAMLVGEALVDSDDVLARMREFL